MIRGAILLAVSLGLSLAACGGGENAGAPEAAAPPAAVAKAATKKLPAPTSLPCFECHDRTAFEKGPPFPHAKKPHREAGHCSVCHAGLGHEGVPIDRKACLECHEESEVVDALGPPPGAAAPAKEAAPAK